MVAGDRIGDVSAIARIVIAAKRGTRNDRRGLAPRKNAGFPCMEMTSSNSTGVETDGAYAARAATMFVERRDYGNARPMGDGSPTA
jgi:hypothetical protein